MEIIGVDGHLVFDGCQFVGVAQTVGNERRVVDAFRHVALVAGEQQHVVEVEVARLQHAHDLKTFGGLTVEGDAGLLDDLRDQSLQGVLRHRQVATALQVVETVDQHIGTEQRLLEHRIADVGTTLGGHLAQELCQRLLVVADVFGIGMALEGAKEAGRTTLQLQVEPELDERGDGRLRERIARGDIHLGDLVGQAVDDGGQEVLVAEHDGRAATGGNAGEGARRVTVGSGGGIVEPGADEAGLDILGGCGDNADVVLVAEVAIDGFRRGVEFVREVLEITADVLSGLVMLHVIVVEVPVEMRLALLLQVGEQLLFDLLQQIEAYEEVVVVRERCDVSGSTVDSVTDDLAVEGSFVGQTLSGQTAVEVVVDVGKVAPQAEESLLQFGVVILGEITKEAANHLALFVGEIRNVVELVDVAQVGEDAVGIG